MLYMFVDTGKNLPLYSIAQQNPMLYGQIANTNLCKYISLGSVSVSYNRTIFAVFL